MNKTVVVSVGVLAFAAAICFGIYVYGNRYYAVNAGEGRVYRVDRLTGGTVLIYGSREIPVDQADPEKKRPSTRDLQSGECSKLTGRGGLSFGNYFSGSIYNGNDGVTVTELRIMVTTTINGQGVSRSYRDDVSISPRTTGDFGFSIIVGDEGATYQWYIEGASGRP